MDANKLKEGKALLAAVINDPATMDTTRLQLTKREIALRDWLADHAVELIEDAEMIELKDMRQDVSTLREEFEVWWFPLHFEYEPNRCKYNPDDYEHIGPTLAWRAYRQATERVLRIVTDDSEAQFRAKHFYVFRSHLIHHIKGGDNNG